jgi:hypothetical protein
LRQTAKKSSKNGSLLPIFDSDIKLIDEREGGPKPRQLFFDFGGKVSFERDTSAYTPPGYVPCGDQQSAFPHVRSQRTHQPGLLNSSRIP